MLHNQKSVLLLLSLALTLISCVKTDIPKGYEPIIGKWKWWFSCCGYGGIRIDPSTEGYELELSFNRNGVLKIYKNGKLHERLICKFEKHKSIYTGKDEYMLACHNSRLDPKSWYINVLQSIVFHGRDTLILREECYDCFAHYYIRIE